MQKYMLVLAVAVLAACGGAATVDNLAGTYNMVSQTFKGTSIDTTDTQQKQLKIYTDSFVMYVHVNPSDSVGAFGVGAYTLNGNKLMEDITYSAGDSAENQSTFPDTVTVTKNNKGYSAILAEANQGNEYLHLSQEYESVATGASSPLDGVWKQVSAYTVKGNDTTRWNDTQYKTFYKGNFAYGEYAPGAARGTYRTYVSYGTFVLNGNTLTETITSANSAAIIGKVFKLTADINGNDAFTQTIIDGNIKEVILYERVRK